MSFDMESYFAAANRVNTGSNEGIYALTEAEVDKMLLEAVLDGSAVAGVAKVSYEIPVLCSHNCWDNLRTKKDLVTMRCRECSMQWKATKDFVEGKKCEQFSNNSCGNSFCEKLHIFRFKLPAKKRSKLLKKKAEQLTAATTGPTI